MLGFRVLGLDANIYFCTIAVCINCYSEGVRLKMFVGTFTSAINTFLPSLLISSILGGII